MKNTTTTGTPAIVLTRSTSVSAIILLLLLFICLKGFVCLELLHLLYIIVKMAYEILGMVFFFNFPLSKGKNESIVKYATYDYIG